METDGLLKSTGRLEKYAQRRKNERKNWRNHDRDFEGVQEVPEDLYKIKLIHGIEMTQISLEVLFFFINPFDNINVYQDKFKVIPIKSF